MATLSVGTGPTRAVRIHRTHRSHRTESSPVERTSVEPQRLPRWAAPVLAAAIGAAAAVGTALALASTLTLNLPLA